MQHVSVAIKWENMNCASSKYSQTVNIKKATKIAAKINSALADGGYEQSKL